MRTRSKQPHENLLGMNLFPTRICRWDSSIVLRIVSEVLQQLKQLNSAYHNDIERFNYKGGRVSIYKWYLSFGRRISSTVNAIELNISEIDEPSGMPIKSRAFN